VLVGAMLWRCGGQVTWDDPLASGGSGAQWPTDGLLGGYAGAGSAGGAGPVGATGYDGGLDGIVCEAEAALWHDWMNARSISWTAWKLDDCTPDSTCILREDAPLDGGYTDDWLHGHGPFVRDRMRD
jgi:hypothetical protein